MILTVRKVCNAYQGIMAGLGKTCRLVYTPIPPGGPYTIKVPGASFPSKKRKIIQNELRSQNTFNLAVHN